jgi:hypothetical protein
MALMKEERNVTALKAAAEGPRYTRPTTHTS